VGLGAWFAGELPGLGVLPTRVAGVVEVQKQAFAAVEEAKAKEIIPLEANEREDDDAREEGEDIGAGAAVVDKELGPQRAVAVHVLDVGRERWIGVVKDVTIESGRGAAEADGLMDRTGFELGGGGKVAAEEAELGVGVEAAMFDPTAKKKIASLEVKGVDGWL